MYLRRRGEMTAEKKKVWDLSGLTALIFDMDGVLTQTARVHKQAWEKMFTAFLADLDTDPYRPDKDYARYIDGKPRYKGVASFLASRDIHLPFGEPDDEPGAETVCGLGNRKNELFLQILENQGVDVYADAIDCIKKWKKQRVKTAVVSSSKNCKRVLEKAGLEPLFDVRVDGLTLEKRNLNGKPHPDMFLLAAHLLSCHARDSAIFEDSISGVKAGKAGHFACVVGVVRDGSDSKLKEHGAHIVIKDFNELI